MNARTTWVGEAPTVRARSASVVAVAGSASRTSRAASAHSGSAGSAPGAVRHPAQVGPQALGDEGEPGVRLEDRDPAPQGVVEGADGGGQRGVGDGGAVDGPPDETGIDHVGLEVQDPLGEPGRGGGPPVVGDVRRQQRDQGSGDAVITPVEGVADRALVDRQDRPGVVGVARVGVVDEAGVEHLAHPCDVRVPRLDVLVRAGCDHAKNVQDGHARPGVRSRHGRRRRR